MGDISSDIYGYHINSNLLYRVSDATLFNTDRISSSTQGQKCCIKMRKTMASLMEYLLAHARSKYVSDKELITHVWEENGLKGSSARLLQVMTALKKNLTDIGCNEHFIARINGKGYMIMESRVSILYSSSASALSL